MVFQIKRSTVELYDGIGEPPSWKLTLQASSTGDAIADLNETVILTDNSTLLSKKRWTIPIRRMAGKLTLTTPPANWVKSPGQFNNYRECYIESRSWDKFTVFTFINFTATYGMVVWKVLAIYDVLFLFVHFVSQLRHSTSLAAFFGIHVWKSFWIFWVLLLHTGARFISCCVYSLDASSSAIPCIHCSRTNNWF